MSGALLYMKLTPHLVIHVHMYCTVLYIYYIHLRCHTYKWIYLWSFCSNYQCTFLVIHHPLRHTSNIILHVITSSAFLNILMRCFRCFQKFKFEMHTRCVSILFLYNTIFCQCEKSIVFIHKRKPEVKTSCC